MRVDELDTPVPVIDLDRVEHNLAKMQAYCDLHGLKLRPHIKTHKLPAFARRQLELGAVGITCQKIGEARVMAEAGCADILLTYPVVGATKVAPLAEVAARTRLTVALDNAVALETVARAAHLAGTEIGVLVEFDSGDGRCGVQSADEALELARRAHGNGPLAFRGFMTYPHGPRTAPFLAAARPLFEAAGIPVETVSIGGTPGCWDAHLVEGATELRVGTYIYHDRATVGAGVAAPEDCALHVHATVVSRPTATRAVIDAGSKTLSSDRVAAAVGEGYGHILEYPDAVITRLNEEHGVVDLSDCDTRPAIGERIRILPNHVCVVSNLHDAVVVGRNGTVVDTWPVAARGCTR
ncbi:alanine racemase [Azospirillum halopraeferens]|uniref:alanine racemase n=1 Tax=Azospirillum halopraeferens TaxID=34010 RepID=UPI0003F97CF0|nr:alanine racemase [Azospirillum halopraeferens]